MTKFVSFFAALLLVCALGYSQKTNMMSSIPLPIAVALVDSVYPSSPEKVKVPQSDITAIIAMSKEANKMNGVTDSSKIFPGQVLTFLFKDGSIHSIIAEKGDCMWTIIGQKLSKLENLYGPVVDYHYPVALDSVKHDTVYPHNGIRHMSSDDSAKPSIFGWLSSMPWWAWLFIGMGILFLIALINKEKEKRMNIDPITAGPAQVPGGISDAAAHERVRNIAASRFPGARLNIKNIRRGHLSGKGMVHYANGTKAKKINLKNIAAYAGEVTINDTDEQTIYFLQGCGNDTAVSHMSGDELVFTPDVVINSDGSESPIPTPPVAPERSIEAEEDLPTTIPPPAAINLGSEHHQHVAAAQTMVAEFLKSGQAKHKVVMKITHESFEVTIEDYIDKAPRSSGAGQQ